MPQTRLPLLTKVAYGLGKSPDMIKLRSFDLFVLFFYSQVLGLSGTLTGLAIFLVICTDAVWHPLAGVLSDGMKNAPLGRRLTPMVAAAVPASVGFFLLFSPPAGLHDGWLFAWMLGSALLLRVSMSFYQIPYISLQAELSDQRSDRAHLLIMASLSRMLTEFILLYVAFNLFFHATAAFPNGQQDASAYPGYGLVMGLVMGTGMLACTAVLYPAVRRMRTYRHSSPARVQGLFSLRLWHELLVASPSYRALVSAVLVFAVATGLNSALLLYLGTYLFRLTPPQMAIWSQALLVGAAICLMLGVNWVVRRFEVRSVFATAMVSYATVEVIMVAIVLLGLWPADVPLIWLLGVGNFIAGMFNAANMVAPPLLVSISADDYELRTGQPQQGLMFGLVHFAQQAGTAFGNLFAGVFLDVVAFPKGAPVSEVGMAEISAIAWFYIAAMATANIAGFTLMRGYRLRNADHDVVVRQLAAQRAQVGADGHGARAPVGAAPLGAAE